MTSLDKLVKTSKQSFIENNNIIDTVIIGAGVGGLELGINKSNKNKGIVILDQSDYIGGRVRSVKTSVNGKTISYEAGAARFNKNHTSLLSVIKRYNLQSKMIKIPSYWEFRPTSKYEQKAECIPFDNVDQLISSLIEYYDKPKWKQYLKHHTLFEACKDLYGNKIAEYLANSYSYYSEIKIFNGNNSIRTLKNDLGEHNQFYVLAGGLSQVPRCQAQDFISKSPQNYICLKTQAQGWTYDDKTKMFTLKIIDLDTETKYTLKCRNLVLAVDGKSVRRWKPQLKKISPKIGEVLGHVTSQPLLRVYALYNSKWFAKYGKVVTDGLVKYVIPIDAKSGLVMISYTDGEYVRKMMRHINDGTQEKAIYESLKEIFPDDKIEKKPAYLMNEYWDCGAVYWNRGADSAKMSRFIMKPSKRHNLFICGDSFSENQAWTDGAIYNAREVAKLIR